MSDELEWRDRDLSGESFAGADLAGVQLAGCRIVACSFRGANLRGARFEDCVAFDPDTEDCADFSFANLRDAGFLRCDLTAAEFQNVSGYELCFEHCQLGGVNLSGSDFRLPIGETADLTAFTMRHCNFAYGDLSNTYLRGCELTDNRMIEMQLHNTVLTEAVFRGSDICNVSGSGISLRGADLREATFNNLDPRTIDLEGVQINLEQALVLLEPLGVIVDGPP